MKAEIKKCCKEKYSKDFCNSFLSWDGKEIVEFDKFFDLKSNEVVDVNYDNDFFFMLQVSKFGEKLLLEYIYLGDEVDYHKDWSYKVFMKNLKSVCDSIDDVYVNNYDDCEEREFRAFFLATLININNYKNFNEVYIQIGERCSDLVRIAENKLKGRDWDEKDEKLFCDVFLTPFFKSYPFKSVRYTHGNKEFGKDYILKSEDIFGNEEFYGVQAKAGDINGAAKGIAQTIVEQIKMAFTVPYEMTDREIYISKLIIATSGVITDNAKKIIKKQLNEYMFTNVIFMDKKTFVALNHRK